METRCHHFPAVTQISRRGAVVVVEHAAQPLPAQHCSIVTSWLLIWHDQAVSQTRVVALAMVMQNELSNCCAQRALTKEQHPIQARFLDAADESLGVRFRFGERGGSFTDFTPMSASIVRNSIVNSGSRS
jgi:hypothetical protein